jgi:hypothetical protein
LLGSSEILEISDPPVSEIGPFDFAEFGPTDQVVALDIDHKPDCSVWQTGTSDFSRKLNFSRFD